MLNRRSFIKQGAITSIALSPISARRVTGANGRIRIGLIGCGGRGKFDARHFRLNTDAEIAAVCDVNAVRSDEAKELFEPQLGAFKDFRTLLEQKELDAVIVATPDHWHAATAVLACQAEKDVYVEKPLAYSIREGRMILDAARRYNRIVQTGTQQRSAPHFEEVRQIIQSGELGKVHFIRIWNYRNMYPIGMGKKPDSETPPELDWDFYLGPAPMVPYNENRFRNFRWFRDYSGGTITDYGTHRFDTMHEIMEVDAPLAVSASGGRFSLDDGGDQPDVLQVTYEYPNCVVSYEANILNAHGVGGRTPGKNYYNMADKDDRPNGIAFYGTNGALFADRIGYEIYPEKEPRPLRRLSERDDSPPRGYRMERKEATAEDATALHVRNFLDCIKSRSKPAADVEIGHRSTIVPHLGNIARTVGRKIKWDSQNETIVDDKEASKLLGREYRKPWDMISS